MKARNHGVKALAASLLCTILLAGCARGPVERTWLSMGTFAAVSTSAADAARIDEAQAIVSSEFNRLEQLWSNYISTSEISRLNAGAGHSVAVSKETADLLRLAKEYSDGTGGCFDSTVGPLVRLWGIGASREFRIPSDEEITEALLQCGSDSIECDANTASLRIEGMAFDSGGIAKGLAVDICAEKLNGAGFVNHMVNLGGNMRCYGSGKNGGAWRVGVRNPFERDKIVGVLALTDGMAVATSGNYERFVTKDGKRYAHIIDPRTGRPVEGMAGVTVVAPTATQADALSTALFVAGVEERSAILSKYPDVEVIFVEDCKPIVLKVSAGIKKVLQVTDDVAVEIISRP